MEKFIPYEKLSKKKKRKMDLAKRQTWGNLNPVTRKPANSKAYNRRKAQNWKNDFRTLCLYVSDLGRNMERTLRNNYAVCLFLRFTMNATPHRSISAMPV